MRRYFIEAVGTFFLVLTIGMTVIAPGADTLAPLAIGSVLAVMVYMGGPISGGHYNPAVSLGVWLRGKLPAADLGAYIVAQVAGGILAALIVAYLKGDAMQEVVALDLAVMPALIVEFLFTFALVLVVLNVATAKGTAGNSYFGLAIGFTVMVGAFSVGTLSGGAFNPAVAVAISSLGLVPWSAFWIYLLANFAAGALAAVAFKYTHPGE